MARLILSLTIALTAALAHAQQEAAPRVLILGDSIYGSLSRELTKHFKGKAEVVYASWQPGEVADTTTALQVLDRLLGNIDRSGKSVPPAKRKKWDVIHFNFGLGDLIHRMPDSKSLRVMPIHVGGIRNTDPKRYEANLQELVKRLTTTGAKLIWASTTPIRHSSSNVFELGSEIQYNSIAAKIMAAHGIPINDMYTHAKSLIDMDKPAGHGADPFFFDRKPLHPPVAAAIERRLETASRKATSKSVSKGTQD